MLYGVFAALPEPHTGRVWHQRRIRTAFENAVEAAKLDDFRVSMAPVITSRMRGCGLQALKELLGHADIKTTLIYAHLSPAHLRSEVARTPRAELNPPRFQRKAQRKRSLSWKVRRLSS
jgi:site-specific recombinase XerC